MSYAQESVVAYTHTPGLSHDVGGVNRVDKQQEKRTKSEVLDGLELQLDKGLTHSTVNAGNVCFCKTTGMFKLRISSS